MTYPDHSLSVVLPVYNAQNSLPGLITEMLEILPDVAPQFEVLIVDDGSTDRTEEVAHELAGFYPQLRVVRHQTRLGGEAVIQTGYDQTSGRVVIVQQENTCLRLSDLRQLGQLGSDRGLVVDSAAGKATVPPHHMPARRDEAVDKIAADLALQIRRRKARRRNRSARG